MITAIRVVQKKAMQPVVEDDKVVIREVFVSYVLQYMIDGEWIDVPVIEEVVE